MLARKTLRPHRSHQHLRVFQGGFDDKARRGHMRAGLYVMSNSQNNIVMTDENKIIGDAFAIFVKLFIVILTVVRFFPIET